MSGKIIAITGASRGLGLILTKEFLAAGDKVFALVRNTGKILPAFDSECTGKLIIVSCDVGSSEGVRRAAGEVKAHTDHLDMLINNAGVNLDMDRVVDYTQTNFDEMEKTFNINTAGVMRVVQAFDCLLRSGSLSAAISSSAGSIARNPLTETEIAYRVSKAALNMAFKLYTNTVKKRRIRTLLIDPGWMRTGMGGPGADCDPEENGHFIAELLNNVDRIQEGTLFVDYRGKGIPW
jgi:NAD(P)-dependent dehydrogenase (short-subunit alcohol dehydrogenase family)